MQAYRRAYRVEDKLGHGPHTGPAAIRDWGWYNFNGPSHPTPEEECGPLRDVWWTTSTIKHSRSTSLALIRKLPFSIGSQPPLGAIGSTHMGSC